jgi:hypothetical protein
MGSLLSFLGCSLDPPTFASAIKCPHNGWNGSPQVRPLACFTASEITNHPVSFATATFSRPPAERRATKNNEMGVFQTPRWACDHRCDTGLYLLCFVSPYPEVLIPVSPRYEVEKGPPVRAVHSHRSRRISGNRKRTSLAPKSGSIMYLSSSSCLSGCSKPGSPL